MVFVLGSAMLKGSREHNPLPTKPMTVTTINNVQEWRSVQTHAANAQAQLLLLLRLNTDGEFPEQVMDTALERWADAIKSAATAPHAFRDAIIRHKAYAFSMLTSAGQSGNVEAFQKLVKDICFVREAEVLIEGLTEEEFRAEEALAYDLDVSLYIEAASGYYCNQLLNLADDGNRELIPQDHWSYKRTVELTAKLEERGLFDSIFVARVGIIYSFLSISGMAFRSVAQQLPWLQSANGLLNELNNVPLAVA